MRRVISAPPTGVNAPAREQVLVGTQFATIPVIEIDDETGIIYAGDTPINTPGGGGGGPLLQVDGVDNAVQDLLNLVSSTVGVTDGGDGSVSFDLIGTLLKLFSIFGPVLAADSKFCSGRSSVAGGSTQAIDLPSSYSSPSNYIIVATPSAHAQPVSAAPVSNSQFNLTLGGSSPANDDVINWLTVGISQPL